VGGQLGIAGQLDVTGEDRGDRQVVRHRVDGVGPDPQDGAWPRQAPHRCQQADRP